MNKRPIRILSNLARAGGTLVSKCLGSMDNVVLLSEIHPLGTQFFDPLRQAQSWYDLLRPEDLYGRQLDLVDAIRLIEQRCTEQGKTLLIRDWAHLDFIGTPFIANPPNKLQLTECLAPEFSVLQHAVTRHPVDQWLSTARLDIMRGRLGLDAFLAGYRRFAEECVKTGFTRYEDFTRKPAFELQKLCARLEMKYDGKFIKRWHRNTRVTGDMSGSSRGSKLRTIRPLAQPPVAPDLLSVFQQNPDYREAISLLGYQDPAEARQ